MAYSPTYANKMLAKVFNGTAFSFTPYVSLHTADPGLTGASEVSGGGYARFNASACFGSAASGGTIATSSAITLSNLPACTVTYVGIWDAASSGNFVQGGALAGAVAVTAGQSFSIASGQAMDGFSDSPIATSWTTYLRNAMLNYMFRGTAFSNSLYASLHTADPGNTGASEVAGGSYARFSLTFAAPALQGTSNTNSGSVTSMPSCTVSYAGIFDAVSSGNFLMRTPLISPVVVAAASSWIYNAGDITATQV